MKKSAKIIVTGLVQGVGYRYFCYNEAVRLGITGYARNLYDGNVELEVECEENVFDEFVKKLKQGPFAAKVTDVRIEDMPFEGKYDLFKTR